MGHEKWVAGPEMWVAGREMRVAGPEMRLQVPRCGLRSQDASRSHEMWVGSRKVNTSHLISLYW